MRFHRNYLFLIPLLAVAYTYSGYDTVINVERHFNGQQIAATPFTITTNGRAQVVTAAAKEAGPGARRPNSSAAQAASGYTARCVSPPP